MKKITIVTAITCAGMMLHAGVQAQGFFKRLKDKASDVSNRVIDKKVDKVVDKAVGIDGSSGTTAGSASTRSTSSSGRPTNKVGEGLKNTAPPDVLQQISEAETAQNAGNLSDARYSITQALLGVELQIGKELLKSLPASAVGLPKDETQDIVTSSQWGWANMTIQRVYKQNDKQLTVLIGNNSLYAGFVNMFFAGNYTESNSETQNFKQIKVKGNKAVIKFAHNEGYTLLVQLGQSSLITFEGVNFSTEQDMMAAANSFDIDGIKKMLGEK